MKAIFQILLISHLSLYAVSAHAEGGASHGGVAVVCRDPAYTITEAFLLDTFEAKYLNGKSLLDSLTGSYADVRGHIQNLTSDYTPFLPILDRTMGELKSRYRFLGKDVQLEVTMDVFPIINRRGCKIEQLANFRDQEKDILIDREIYDALTPLDRVGLELHEALYYLDRKWVNSQDSRRARTLVGEFLSTGESRENVNTILQTYEFGVARSGVYFANGVANCQVSVQNDGADGNPWITALTNCGQEVDGHLTPVFGTLHFQNYGETGVYEWRSPSNYDGSYSHIVMTNIKREEFYLNGTRMVFQKQ